jgi:hypothetical protein
MARGTTSACSTLSPQVAPFRNSQEACGPQVRGRTPAEILASGPSCVSRHRSSNATSLMWPVLAEPTGIITISQIHVRARIFEFESHHPSHAVRSLPANSVGNLHWPTSLRPIATPLDRRKRGPSVMPGPGYWPSIIDAMSLPHARRTNTELVRPFRSHAASERARIHDQSTRRSRSRNTATCWRRDAWSRPAGRACDPRGGARGLSRVVPFLPIRPGGGHGKAACHTTTARFRENWCGTGN